MPKKCLYSQKDCFSKIYYSCLIDMYVSSASYVAALPKKWDRFSLGTCGQ